MDFHAIIERLYGHALTKIIVQIPKSDMLTIACRRFITVPHPDVFQQMGAPGGVAAGR